MPALLALALFAASPAFAGEVGQSVEPRGPWAINAGYYGETVFHPGLAVGVERKLLFFGAPPGLVEHGLFAGANLGTWWHARNAVGVFAEATAGYRLVFPLGFRLELLGSVGYLHTFLAAPVYAVDGSGAAREVLDAGQPGLLFSGALGLGFDFSVLKVAPLAVFLRGGVFGQYPYNTAVLPHLQAQLGVSIPFGGG